MAVELKPWLGLYRNSARNDGNDAAKLAALILMVINHLLLAWPWPWPVTGYLAGRACIPVFAFVIMERLLNGPPDRAGRMLARLTLWAVLSQPVYYLLVSNLTPRLNVLATFATGVALATCLRKKWWLALMPGIAAAMLASKWLDGGAGVVVGMLAAAALYPRSRYAALAAVTAGAIAADLIGTPEVPLAMLTALGGPLLILLSPYVARFVPRLPLGIFYLFYPAHLLVIWLVYGPYP